MSSFWFFVEIVVWLILFVVLGICIFFMVCDESSDFDAQEYVNKVHRDTTLFFSGSVPAGKSSEEPLPETMLQEEPSVDDE